MKAVSLGEIAELVSQFADQSLQKGDSGSFLAFSSYLGAVKNELREQMQDATRPSMEKIVEKLRQKQKLSAEELGLVRLWIIGSAESYTKQENDLKNWFSEVKRLTAEIQKFKGLPSDAKTALSLQGWIVDLDRNLQDIIHLLEELERSKRFIDSTREIDGQEAELLASMIDRKLRSAEI